MICALIVALSLAQAPSAEAIAAGRAALERAVAAEQARDFAGARVATSEAFDAIARVPDDEHVIALLDDVVLRARALGDLDTQFKALGRVLSFRERTGPSDDHRLLTAKADLGVVLNRRGDLEGARKQFEGFIAIRARSAPEDDLELLRVRQNLGSTLAMLGDLDGARRLLDSVLAVRMRSLAPDHPDVLASRESLAFVIKQQGDLVGARRLEEEVLAAYERSLPDEHMRLQGLRSNLGETLFLLGELEAARALQEKALAVALRTIPEDHPFVQTVRLQLAETHVRRGAPRDARPLQECALRSLSRTLGVGAPEVLMARGRLALTLRDLGELDAAIALQESVLDARSLASPPDDPDLQAARVNLAGMLRQSGDLRRARALGQAAVDAFSRTLPEDHPHLLTARLGLASTLGMLGDLAASRALFEDVFAARSRTLPDDHPDLQSARSALAVALKQSGDYRAAEQLEEQVLDVVRRTLPPDHPMRQEIALNLASTRYRLGDLAGALALLENVLSVQSQVLPADHPHVQMTRHNLARVLRSLGRLQEARALLDEALAAYVRILPPDHPFVQKTRNESIWTLALQGDTAAMASLLRDAAGGIDARLAATVGLPAREAEAVVADLARTLSNLVSFAPVAGFPREECFRLVETARSFACPPAVPWARLPPNDPMHAVRSEALAARRALGDLLAPVAGGALPETTEVGAAVRAVDEIEGRLRRDLAARGIAPVEVTSSNLARSLEPGSIAVGYAAYDAFTAEPGANRIVETRSLVAHVLRADGSLVAVDLGDLKAIDLAVARFAEAVGGPMESASDVRGRPAGAAARATTTERAAGEALRALVLDPVLANAGDPVDTLIVCLDDVLHRVPLDALPVDGGVVGDRTRILYEVSFARRMQHDAKRVAGTGLLAVGAIDYGALDHGTGAPAFTPLAATGPEIEALVDLFEGTFPESHCASLRGTGASKDAVASRVQRCGFVHIATHGLFDVDRLAAVHDGSPGDALSWKSSLERTVTELAPSTLCGLALSGANLGHDGLGRYPGLITAEEIAGWDLSQCELAVLSACDTNVGIRRAGQGVASLQKALHRAGARSVITSLWKVPDEATRQLMLDVYHRLWVEKKPKHQALWEAKMRIRDAKGDDGAPKYATRDWAAWVLTGDPE